MGLVGVSATCMSLHHLAIMTMSSLSCLLCFLCMLAIPIFPFVDLLVYRCIHVYVHVCVYVHVHFGTCTHTYHMYTCIVRCIIYILLHTSERGHYNSSHHMSITSQNSRFPSHYLTHIHVHVHISPVYPVHSVHIYTVWVQWNLLK